jgi:N-acetylmuramoyl-L-alanine amidase
VTDLSSRNSHRRRLTTWAAACLLAALPLTLDAQRASNAAAASQPAALAVVRGVSRSTLPHGERISIEFSDEISYFSDRVPNPDRVYFDFKNAVVGTPVIANAHALGSGTLVASVRIARHTEQTTRLVLDLTGHPRYSVFSLYNPFRLVVDVETDPVGAGAAPAPPLVARPTAAEPPATAPSLASPTSITDPTPSAEVPAPPPPSPSLADRASPDPSLFMRAQTKPATLSSPAPASAMARGDYSLARQLGLGVSRIVIDPGHGGHDPGAQSNGITESELVLDVALRLEKLLKDQPGVDVVLTRRVDEFIPLEERTAIANREGADLFLSIHANASRQPIAQGVETYFLNFSTNPAAEAVAARENATSGRTMGNLPDLVKTIALNNKVVESRELATIVQTTLVRHLRLQNKSLRDLGVKQAPFVVLIGAQMPSVLAEISFITNRSEASLLKQAPYRQRIAQSLFDGVLKYQSSLKKVTSTASARPDKQ